MLEQIRATLLEEYSVSQWVLLFFLYSFCGWCWEVFLYLVKERRFVNRGFLFGPILPIYGFGAVGILLTCVPVEGNMALVALVGRCQQCVGGHDDGRALPGSHGDELLG